MKRLLLTFLAAGMLMIVPSGKADAAPDVTNELAAAYSFENSNLLIAREGTTASVMNHPPIGSTLSSQEVRQLIGLHNQAREAVSVAPLAWSSELARYAQEWADHLASASCSLEHRPRSGKWKQKHGENLFMGTARHYGVADAVRSWEGEKRYYRGQRVSLSNVRQSGHYTQIVWKDTKRIGCAKAECNGNIIVVCNYDPPGNIMGWNPY